MSRLVVAHRFLKRLLTDARAQDTVEMLLITGAVVVLMLTVFLAGTKLLVPQVIGNACGSIDTGFQASTPTPVAVGSCIQQ